MRGTKSKGYIVKIGVISARMHLLEARRNHRILFVNGSAVVSSDECRKVNDQIGAARRKLYLFGVCGKCNDVAYKNASEVVKSLFLQKKRQHKKDI